MTKLTAALLFFCLLTASPAYARNHHHRHHYAHRTEITHGWSSGGVIGGRPSGCPYRYCGCEASRYVFGKIIPELNLASNWIRKFPRTSPAPGMAAARSGHVFILISHVSGNDWMIHDGNSGGHLTREHVRSISGYVIVNPHAGRYAANW